MSFRLGGSAFLAPFYSFFSFFLGRNLDIHHDTISTGGYSQGGIFDISRLFTEDRPQQTLFRSQLGFTLGSNLTHQNITRLNLCTNTDNTIHSQVLQSLFSQVGNITSDFLRSQLGIASADFKLIDVNGGENIIFHDPFADQDGILEVIPIPRHEGDQDVFAQSQLTIPRARTVSNHFTLFNLFPMGNKNPLVNTGSRIRTHELADGVDTDSVSRIVLEFLLGQRTIFCDHDLISTHRRDFAIDLRNNNCT